MAILSIPLAALALSLLPRTSAMHFWREPVAPAIAGLPTKNLKQSWTDRFEDGTPDFLRLHDPADQAAFRRWFVVIAEYQAVRPFAEVPAEIADCASLLRYSYREALKRHNDRWFVDTRMEVLAPPGEIRAWTYPHTLLGAALFRTRPGSFLPADLTDGTFAEFADARTLVERNAYFVSRDVRLALPGDLLFYRQFGQTSPWHSMIVTRTGVAKPCHRLSDHQPCRIQQSRGLKQALHLSRTERLCHCSEVAVARPRECLTGVERRCFRMRASESMLSDHQLPVA